MELQIVTFLNHLGQGTFLDNFTFFISDRLFLLGLWVILGILAIIFDKKNGKWVFLGIIIAALIYFVINDFIIKPTIATSVTGSVDMLRIDFQGTTSGTGTNNLLTFYNRGVNTNARVDTAGRGTFLGLTTTSGGIAIPNGNSITASTSGYTVISNGNISYSNTAVMNRGFRVQKQNTTSGVET